MQGMISADQLHTKTTVDNIRLHNAQSQPYWRRKLHKRWQSSKARSCNEERIAMQTVKQERYHIHTKI